MMRGELEKAKTESLLALDRDALNVGIYLRMSALERATGDMEAAKQKPEDIDANIQLGDLLRDSGELEAAAEHYQKAQVLQNSPVRPTLRLSLIAARKGNFTTARKYLSEAEGFAKTPMEKIHVRQGAALLEIRLGRIQEAIKQIYAQEEFLRQSQGLLAVTLSVYRPLIDLYISVGDLEAAHGALTTAKDLLTPPVDKFLGFSAAVIQAQEKDIDAAYVSLQHAQDVVDQLQLKYLEAQINMVLAMISEAEGDFAAMADHYQKAIEKVEHSVVAGEELAKAQIETGSLADAEHSIEAGFRLDPSEPLLWVEKARLQQAKNMPRMALASVNYALAIWKDAGEDYVMAKKARALAAELQSISQ